ncbi:MAG: hypothetical protein Q7S40_32750 [Opitutaceae bacterium]|nr:hypothetical protein [Opitutaceae bacterium]
MPQAVPVVACLFGFLTAAITGFAEEVEVTTVRFSNLRGGNGSWLEAAVALNVRPPANSPAQLVSRVRVTLVLALEVPASAGAERRVEHYRARAECVALGVGRTDVRFYLPPEVVRRDQLRGDPRSWGVELAVGGRAVPASRGAYTAALATAEQRKTFQTKAATEAPGNDGILLPQYLTPFANENPRATPSFVRRETS